MLGNKYKAENTKILKASLVSDAFSDVGILLKNFVTCFVTYQKIGVFELKIAKNRQFGYFRFRARV